MKSKNILIAPSILSADFAQMGSAVDAVCAAGADYIHCDVMDGVFVPNITFGIKMIADIKKYSTVPLDVHLMIAEPWKYVEQFAKAGADIISVHYKACGDRLSETLKLINDCGVKSGLAVNPDVPLSCVKNELLLCDMLLIMSVYPGFGGQKYIAESTRKIAEARKIARAAGKELLIEVDGGVNMQTIAEVKAAGADIAVAGSAVFGAEDKSAAIKALKRSASEVENA